MQMRMFSRLLLAAGAVFVSAAAFAQVDIQLRARQLPGWDARSREGRCLLRVWVDNRAEVRMRGDQIFVRTLEGARARDEGSECSQPLPYNYVRDFRIRQTAGRNRVEVAQEPTRANNYGALIVIDDKQGGGDTYTFEVSWASEGNIGATAPAAFFDDVRACQDVVRQSFVSRNGRGSYIDFNGFAERSAAGARGRGNNRNRGSEELVFGKGNARRWNESRDLTYSCVMDNREQRVVSGSYQLSGNSLRQNDRPGDRQVLR